MNCLVQRSLSAVVFALFIAVSASAQSPPVEDRIFIFDGSGSIDASEFNYQRDIIQKVLCGPDAPNYQVAPMGVAVIQFATTSRVDVSYTVIRSAGDAASVCTALDQVTQLNGSTHLEIGLESARDIFVNLGQATSRRLFVMTDGDVTNGSLARAKAAEIRQLPIPVKICVSHIALDCDTGDADLMSIANAPDSDSFNILEPQGVYACTMMIPVADLICTDCACGQVILQPGIDLIFLIDGSGTVLTRWAEMKAAAARFICGDSAPNPLESPFGLAMIQYAATAQVDLFYRLIRTPEDATLACDQMAVVGHRSGDTNLAAGLDLAFNLISTDAISPARQVFIFGDGDTAERVEAIMSATNLRTMPIPVRICTIEFSDQCEDSEALMTLANDVNALTFNPAQSIGRYACTSDPAGSPLLCHDCVCTADCVNNAVFLDDCNGNGSLDICDFASGLFDDCDFNGVLDICEIEAGLAADCNRNGRLDSCERTITFLDETPTIPLVPGFPLASFSIVDLPTAASDVSVTMTASGPLAPSNSLLLLALNGQSLANFFQVGGALCTPVTETVLIPAATFNTLVAGGDANFQVFGANFDPGLCPSPFVEMHTMYQTNEGVDLNNNQILDQCDRATGDSNLNGVVEILDFLAVLATWGTCTNPTNCPSDANIDGKVGIEDFLIVLSNWGPV